MTKFDRLLENRPWLLADGATGTNLFLRGLEQGEAPEFWNLEAPSKVRAHYRDFIGAGSDLVLANSFGGTANRLKLHKAENRVYEINRAATELLRSEVEAAGREVLVAGSIGPTGDLFVPLGPLEHESAAAAFAEQAKALADGGADLLWIETLSSIEEIRAAVEGAAAAGLPIVATLSFDTNGRTMMGVTPADWAALAHDLAVPLAAYGANCGTGAAELVATLLSLREAAQPGDRLVAKANCGIPQWVEGSIRYDGTPALMADYGRLALDAGASIVGGCCGTGVAHLVAIREALEQHEKGRPPSLEEVAQRLGSLSKTALSLAGKAGEEEGGGSRRRRPRRRGRPSF
ncbi:MAG: betaine--homocysteine S-methyltransferase [Rhodospirillales bacterium]|nr:betaine--homocysteine S-methyltransferase [Rhodospirillales bacterium]